jgi:hypothetical protein
MRRCALLVALALVAAPVARADGDPASDYLLSQRVFVPWDGKISSARAAQLRELLTDAERKGYPIRVALIVTRYDLGSVPSLWRKPHEYAQFLGQELFFAYKGRLLVVMPNGYGVSERGRTLPAEQALTDALPKPGANGDAVAAAAVEAVRRLAARDGVTVPVPPLREPQASASNSRDRLLILAAVLVVAGLAAGLYLIRRLRA